MVEITVFVPHPYTETDVRRAVCQALPIHEEELLSVTVRREQLLTQDKPRLSYRLQIGVCTTAEKEAGLLKMRKKVRLVTPAVLAFPSVAPATRPVVVGAGPCGLLCALALAKAGARPYLIERGSRVDERARKVAAFFAQSELDEQSNVAFGEGGAGTFSDGKLKFGTRDAFVEHVLNAFIRHGAPADILYRDHPHVGTDRLQKIVQGLRQEIIAHGGEVLFDTKVSALRTKASAIVGVQTINRAGAVAVIDTDTVFLATGHSARDVYDMLHAMSIPMQARPFGIGVRIEHPSSYIDALVYGGTQPTLGHAPYHLVTHLPGGRSVYSFCMCPGGRVVCSSTEHGGIVTNGMSDYARAAVTSNAALLVSVTPRDFPSAHPLAGVQLQRSIERAAFATVGGYAAPAVRLCDFMQGHSSGCFGDVLPSFPMGTSFVRFSAFFPEYVINSLQKGIQDFDRWLPGYAYADAVLTAPETRTTSPVRIVRDEQTRQTPTLAGLYPCGEGAGYGGGILSSATDGLRAVDAYLRHQQI